MRRNGYLGLSALLLGACGGSVAEGASDAAGEASAVDSAVADAPVDTGPPRLDGGIDAACTEECPRSMAEKGTPCRYPGVTCNYTCAPTTGKLVCVAGTWAAKDETICEPDGNTVGLPCTDDTTCDETGDGVKGCSNTLFTLGTLYPAPVCIG